MARKDIERQLQEEKTAILDALDGYHRRWNRDLVSRAFDFAVESHREQRRQSGEPYVFHPINVAKILIDMKTDYIAVTSGILHDVVEDTLVDIGDVQEKFGEQVALLVDGVTKISGLRFHTYEERQAETMRKMLLSMLRDLRVILIKFADRLHNMRTIESLPRASQRRIAKETWDIYAPLAHRLGIARWAREMENLSLKVLDPAAYEEITKRLQGSATVRHGIVDEFINPINRELNRQGITADVHGRVKSIASIYNKMRNRQKSFNDIHDLLAVRIIVNQKQECYRVLGLVHDIYTPVTDHFTDYIALPKTNFYQSLHTKVRDLHNRIFEVQIRTHEMHSLAENGFAAHWRYKEGPVKQDELAQQFAWVRSLMELHQEGAESGDFLESLKVDLFQDEIFVFTPKGRVVNLPRGATPIDFAFSIHSDVGLHAIGAKVAGRIVPLSSELESGQMVEIITSPNHKPSVEWLKIVKTSRARNRIKKWLRDTRWEQARALGQEMIVSELNRLKLKINIEQLQEVAQSFGYNELTEFYASVGSGVLTLGGAMRKIVPTAAPDKETLISRIIPLSKGSQSVRVSGLDTLIISIADCCNALPGDAIVGFQTSGDGLAIHRTECRKVAQLIEDKAKMVQVTWDVEPEDRFKAQIRVVADDRLNLLRDITVTIASVKVNLLRIEMHIEERLAVGLFEAEVRNLLHLTKLITALNKINGVLSAERVSLASEARQFNGNGREL